ncbi:MAG TPA: peptide ABC transporter substrate-binding protein [Steroidobacteraceae bacterium]|nr:peptide ABC transporter substrate-binding protein [Steroidobacteraceae bacterium]
MPGAASARRRAVGVAGLALAVLVFCATEWGCSRSAPSGVASAAPELLRGNGTEPDSLDPQKARTVQAQDILRDVCESLTSIAHDAGVAPGVAREWSASADGLTYTFHLRPEARWSNGERVVGADFVAALQRLVDPATASPYAQVIDVVHHARQIIAGEMPASALGVTAPDDSTVVVTLDGPAPYLPALLAHPSTCPVHRPSLARLGAGFARPGAMLSNGAFVLSDWVPGAYVLAVRNPKYWNDAATHLAAVRFLQIPDENAELTRYRAGDLDITSVVPRSQLDWIRAHVPGQLHVSAQLSTYFYGFNLQRAPFRDNPKLRQALSMVIDRERLTQLVLRTGELPAYGWVPPGVANYTPQSFDYRALSLEERVARARRLYAEAGYSAQKPLSIELRYNSAEINERLAIAITSMWKESLGVQATLVAEEFKSLLSDIDRGQAELFRSSWVGDYNDAYTFAQYLRSDFGVNLPHYKSVEYDALLDAAAAQTDPAKRRELLEHAERVALADHPFIPLYFYVNKHLVKPRVRGWYDNVLNVIYSKDLALGAP